MTATTPKNSVLKRVSALGLAVLAWSVLAPTAQAGALVSRDYNFSTAGNIKDSTGLTGPSAVGAIGTAATTLKAPGPFSLGRFQVAKLGPRQTATYNNTPFNFTFFNDDIDPIVFSGVLNGVLNADGKSSVVAKFNNTTPVSYNYLDTTHTVTLAKSEIALSNNGSFDIQAQLNLSPITTDIAAVPVPEPATLSVLAAGILALGWTRRRHRVTRIAKV